MSLETSAAASGPPTTTDKPAVSDQAPAAPNGAVAPQPATQKSPEDASSPSQRPVAANDAQRTGSRSSASAGAAAAPDTEPKKKRSFLSLPRSSSRTQMKDESTPSGTGLSGATVAETESVGRGSKRSFIGQRRAGSTASSKRSQPRPQTSEKAQPPLPAPPSDNRASSTRSKPKTRSGLLACLPCFAPKASHTDDGHAENAKQANNVKPPRTSLPVPPQKPEASTADTSAAESKDPVDEKAEKTGDSQGAERVNPAHGDGTSETTASHANAESTPKIVTRNSSNKQKDTPLPPLPTEEPTAPRLDTMAVPQIGVQGPTPGTTPIHPRPSVEGERMIQDQTPEQHQRDVDLEMRDVPISSHDIQTEEDSESSEQPQTQHSGPTADIPPPPPLQQREEELSRQRTSEAEVFTPRQALLPPMRPEFKGKKCLVLDLDETLVHSSFKVLREADFTIPVEIEGQYHNVYVIKRPGVDQFMKRVGELYEVVVFTASVSKYGDPLLDQLDIHGVVHHRLFRESCYNHQGNYVKDLSQIGRDLKETIIIDNSPTSYIFHPQHAVPISSWFSDAHDNELLDLIPVLEDLAGPQVSDVSLVLDVAL